MTARTLLSGEQVTFGCVAPRSRSGVAALEAAGASSLWVGGHVASRNPSPEAMAWLARLTEQAERAIVGTAVLLLPLYPPAIIAKQIADLDNDCGGRIALGVGVGGEYPAEFAACQVPLAGRGARLDEEISLLRRLWTGEPISWPGPLFPMDEVRIHPAPLQPGGPPVIVAGRQEVAMRRAALLGDGWMPYLFSARRYADSVSKIKELAASAGRSLDGFGWLAYIPISMDDDAGVARSRAADFLGGTYKQDFDAFIDRVAVTGTPDQVVERLNEFVAAGARHLVLMPTARDGGQDMLERILGEVAPRVGL